MKVRFVNSVGMYPKLTSGKSVLQLKIETKFTLSIPSSIQNRAFGYLGCKLDLAGKEVLILPVLERLRMRLSSF